jgi:hypothetical protein
MLKVLTELPPLRELAVAGNPLTETEHYKELILERFPLLQVRTWPLILHQACPFSQS